jgi:hypothetical protein
MARRDLALIGASGEHFVLFQLLRRNLLASLSPTNAYAADIVVFSPSMSVGSMVQVKTRTADGGGGWILSAKHERLVHERLFYALVDLGQPGPVTYVIPSSVVADVLERSHRSWLAITRLDGRPHVDSAVRKVARRYGHPVPGLPDDWLETYRERWDLLTVEGTKGEGDAPA